MSHGDEGQFGGYGEKDFLWHCQLQVGIECTYTDVQWPNTLITKEKRSQINLIISLS